MTPEAGFPVLDPDDAGGKSDTGQCGCNPGEVSGDQARSTIPAAQSGTEVSRSDGRSPAAVDRDSPLPPGGAGVTPMPKPKRSPPTRFSPAAVAAFEFIFRPWMRMRLGEILMTGLGSPIVGGKPLLLVANHASWWDGFVGREVQRRLRPGGPMYSVMSETELARRPFLRFMGAIGIHPRSPRLVRDALRGLESLCRLHPLSTVLYFPQGRIWPSHRRPLGFEPGIGLFARKLDGVVVPMGIHLEPLNRQAPTVFVSVGEPMPPDADVRDLETAVEAEIDLILDFVSSAGEDAPRLWPGPTGSLRKLPPASGRSSA